MVYTTKSAKKLAVYQSQVHQMTLWGHEVHFVHAYHMYVQCACTSAWKLAPQGPTPFYNAIYIYIYIYIHTYIYIYIYI